MGDLFGGGGGTKEKSDITKNVKQSSSQLLGSINPFLAKGAVGDLLKKQSPVGSNLQGIPDVLTFDQFGNPLPVGSNNLPSILPKMVDIGNFNTLFEKADSGSLSPTAQSLLSGFTDTALGGTDYGKLFGSLGLGGSGGSGGGGSVKATPPANIGVLTSNIIKDLPTEFQDFISNTLDASSPERVGEILDDFDTAISTRMQQNAKIAGEDLLDVFAGEGQATSGAAKAELKSLALQAATEANAQIAAGHLEILNQQIQAMQVGTELTNVLTSAGAAEQAHLVALQTAELQANAMISVASINARASTQQALVEATAYLEANRLDLLGTGFKGLLDQSSMEEAARIDSLRMPYDILAGIQNQQLPQKGQSAGIGSILGGALAGAGSLLGGIYGD